MAEGWSFRRNYVFGSNSGAVCVPSRAMVLTGRSWMRSPNNMKGVPTLPRLLEAAGYRTFISGKWHNGEEALLRSFDRGAAVYLGGMADHTQVEVQDIENGGMVRRRVGEKFSSELFADAAIAFLNEQTRTGEGDESGRPFFAYVPFTGPHDPRQPPPEYSERYYRRNLPLPANYMPQHPFDHGAQGSTDAFTYLFDLFPTLLAQGGVEAPPGIDGRDLAPLWSGGDPTWRRSVFLPYRDLMRAVRGDRYKLIVYPSVNHRQLFDLAEDPDELNNLFADPDHRETATRLDSLLEGWRAAMGTPCPSPSPIRRRYAATSPAPNASPTAGSQTGSWRSTSRCRLGRAGRFWIPPAADAGETPAFPGGVRAKVVSARLRTARGPGCGRRRDARRPARPSATGTCG